MAQPRRGATVAGTRPAAIPEKRGDSLAPVETKEREECGSVRMLAGFPLGALLGALLFLRFLGLFLGFSFATLFF